MRLSRIDAVRFGRLQDRSLDGLQTGLNVVLGPNEAGKTSFTDLVRHVLYGFTTRAMSEPGYHSDGGTRHGRLVFADETGEWVVERLEGAHGGPVKVRAPDGSDRPDVLDRIRSGVGRESFRVVFGFGLDEMAQIEAERGTSDDVLSRLYAARTGLGVSPQDVRAKLQAQADALFKARGSAPEVNTLKREIAQAKTELRELEASAERYAEKRAQLNELEQLADQARALRDEHAERARSVAQSAIQVDSRLARLDEIDEAAATQSAELESARARLEGLEADDEVLANAAELAAVLEEVSGFRAHLRALEERRDSIAATRATADTALAALGPGARDVAERVEITPQLLVDVEEWKDRLKISRSRAQESEHLATHARSERSVPFEAAQTTSTVWAVAALVVGVAVAVAGALTQQWIAVASGVMLVGFGAVWFVRARGGSSDQSAALADQSARSAAVAEERARADAQALEQELAAWRAYRNEHGLDQAGQDPEVVIRFLSAVREWRASQQQTEREETLLAAEERWCSAYVARLSHAAPFEAGLDAIELAGVPAVAERLRQRLERARDLARERAQLEELIERLDAEVLVTSAKREAASAAITAVLQDLGMAGKPPADVRARAELAERESAEANEAYTRIERERAGLAGELSHVGDEATMAQARLRLVTAQERLAAAAQRYAVAAAAVALVDRSIAHYQNARQPKVVRVASTVFGDMTDGRYERIVVPADETEIGVVRSGTSEFVPSSELSRGTQEQLYLSLRIALIEQLDEAGPGLPVLMDDVLANFDPGRKAGAVRALDELSRHRQIVFFTCHPETAGLLESVAASPTVIRLDRCS